MGTRMKTSIVTAALAAAALSSGAMGAPMINFIGTLDYTNTTSGSSILVGSTDFAVLTVTAVIQAGSNAVSVAGNNAVSTNAFPNPISLGLGLLNFNTDFATGGLATMDSSNETLDPSGNMTGLSLGGTAAPNGGLLGVTMSNNPPAIQNFNTASTAATNSLKLFNKAGVAAPETIFQINIDPAATGPGGNTAIGFAPASTGAFGLFQAGPANNTGAYASTFNNGNNRTQVLTISDASGVLYNISMDTLVVTAGGPSFPDPHTNPTLTSGGSVFVDANKSQGTVTGGGTYAGMASHTVAGGNTLGTTASLLGGQASGNATVTFNFRDRLPSESSAPTVPPMQYPGQKLVSDVVDVSGINPGDVYALGVTYDPTQFGAGEAGAAAEGLIYVAWLDPAILGGTWVNSIMGNTGGLQPALPVLDTFAHWESVNGISDANLGTKLGIWGVDVADHQAWAILNHDAVFAVVPEPATLGLIALGAFGLLSRRRRH